MKFLLLIFLFAHQYLNAQTQETNTIFDGIVTYDIRSEYVQEDYKLYIGLPLGFNAEKDYPVLYVLDANVTFGMVNDIVRLISFEGRYPQVIVVGIAYKNFSNWINKRGRDFMPNYQGDSGDIEIKKFYQFLSEELIPFINQNYKTNPAENTLYGHSSGAVFGFYVMLNNPALFKNYILTSPSIDEDKDFIKTLENEYFQGHKFFKNNLYTSIGKSENPEFILKYNEFIQNLKHRAYKGLNYKEDILEGTHMSSMAPAFIKGFQFVNSE